MSQPLPTRPPTRTLAPAPLLALAVLLGVTAPGRAADLQVMSVGDSITAGFLYQPRLKTLLEGSGHTVTFVGSQGSGANKHEGFSGKGIYDFVGAIPLASGSKHYITTALDTAWPSVPAGVVPVVLVHIGVNDLGHGLGRSNLTNAPQDGSGHCLAAQMFAQDSSGSWINPMGDLDGMTYGAWLKLRLDTMVDLILAHASHPRLVVAKILPIAKGNSSFQANNDNCCERIKEWNGYWAAKVASISGTDAARITIVDCFSDAEPKRVYGTVPDVSFWGDATVQQSDWVHPNSAVGGGYTLMASKFKAGIDILLSTTPAMSANWSGSVFNESAANDGTISTALTVTLTNDTFTGLNGDDFAVGGKVAASNLPSGLTLVARRTSSTVMTVTLTGAASAHANANDVANLGVTFANSAVASSTASAVTGLSVSDRRIDFNDPAGTLAWSAPNVSVTEGGSVTLTVSRIGGSAGAVGVAYASTPGTAGTADYTPVSGTLSFAAGETSKTVTVQTTQDALVEGAESFTVTLSAATGGATIGSQATTTVTIDDAVVVPAGTLAWSATTATVAEGSPVTLTVTRTGGSAGTVGVSYACTSGSAGVADYTSVTGTLSFAAGETSKTVSVQTTQDTLVEGAETFSVTLSAATGGAVLGASSSATVTISDNDGQTVTPTNSQVIASKSGCGSGSGIAVLLLGLTLAVRLRRDRIAA
ncbi:MAG: hypothetical protein H0X38_00250 [Planctomycetes bacterium]|nr:hypothetical protein [Planctomycetota bacterium]